MAKEEPSTIGTILTVMMNLERGVQKPFVPLDDFVSEFGVNYKDKEGDTALIWACWYGKIEIVSYLLLKGADLMIENNIGMNALCTAKFRKKCDVYNYLYDLIVHCSARNKEYALWLESINKREESTFEKEKKKILGEFSDH